MARKGRRRHAHRFGSWQDWLQDGRAIGAAWLLSIATYPLHHDEAVVMATTTALMSNLTVYQRRRRGYGGDDVTELEAEK